MIAAPTLFAPLIEVIEQRGQHQVGCDLVYAGLTDDPLGIARPYQRTPLSAFGLAPGSILRATARVEDGQVSHSVTVRSAATGFLLVNV